MNINPVTIHWFRRDLRLHDNTSLYYALSSGHNVLPIFIFDTHILDKLTNPRDARVNFIFESLQEIQQQLKTIGSSLHVYYGTPEAAFEYYTNQYQVQSVFANHDYEPYAIERDSKISKQLASKGISLHSYKDQVIFEKDEVLKDDGKPYTVFTPYSRKWKFALSNAPIVFSASEKKMESFLKCNEVEIPSLASMGFEHISIQFPDKTVREDIITLYHQQRDIPSIPGTSRLSVHLRFGTISIRQLAAKAIGLNEGFLNELIWRDFYHQILFHFPFVAAGKSFKPAYEAIPWRINDTEFEAWQRGLTGYPLVDAGMRELNETGFMHNRVRMVTASFLCKHLLLDWRLGEAYFAEKLLDFDFAANNGGWQWASSSGCDAAPYFRVFNPTLQAQKFDAASTYIKKWVPEINSFNYPTPIVIHELARKRCIDTYAKALKEN